MQQPRFFSRIARYFLQGLIILAPLIITIWAVTSLFNFVDSILPNIVYQFFPEWVGTDGQGNPNRIPGLGFLIVLLIVLMVGYISSSFVVGRLVELLDTVLEKTPGIRFIYSTVKDFVEAFAGDKRKFEQAVLVNVDAPDVWRIGFITRKDLHDFELKHHVAVYVPHSYALAGVLYFVTPERIRVLHHLSPADAMKVIVSGGVAESDHKEETKVRG